MSTILEVAKKWREARSALDQANSVIVIGPRHFGKAALCNAYCRMQAQTGQVLCVKISSRSSSLNGQLDYGDLLEAVRSQLGSRRHSRDVDRKGFAGELESLLNRAKSRVLILVGGCGRGNEENHYDLLATLHDVKVNRLGSKSDRMTALSIDDYSLSLYNKRFYLLSDLYSYDKVELQWLSIGETEEALRAVERLEAVGRPGWLAERVLIASGGHPGLIQEIVNALSRESENVTEGNWHEFVENVWRASSTLASLSRALLEDPEGYCQTALEYRDEKPAEASVRVAILMQLGVLKVEMAPNVKLCPGAITTLIERFGRREGNGISSRLGTVLSESGPRLFEGRAIAPTDDELIIVHVSDLHVGDKYRHRLTWAGGGWNPGEESAAELLYDDLNSLGLLGRVDGLVLSGDFVWDGTMEEFRRAKDVIEEIWAKIEVDKDRTLLVPGNHDVRWDPGQFAAMPHQNRASRENFDDFLTLLGKRPQQGSDLLELRSRSNKVVLRIVGFDSNRVEGPEAAGIGFVSRESLADAKARLLDSDKANANVERFTWIALHHHIFPASSSGLKNAQKNRISVMANAAEVLDYANQWKCEVILHGHEHQPSVTVARRWPIDVGDVFAPVAAVGAGSFGVVREYLGPFSRNQYYIIRRRAKDIIIQSRWQADSGVRFVAHSDLSIPRR